MIDTWNIETCNHLFGFVLFHLYLVFYYLRVHLEQDNISYGDWVFFPDHAMPSVACIF